MKKMKKTYEEFKAEIQKKFPKYKLMDRIHINNGKAVAKIYASPKPWMVHKLAFLVGEYHMKVKKC